MEIIPFTDETWVDSGAMAESVADLSETDDPLDQILEEQPHLAIALNSKNLAYQIAALRAAYDSIREINPGLYDSHAKQPQRSTYAPGSPEKIALMIKRVEARQEACHRKDRQIVDRPDADKTAPFHRNGAHCRKQF